MSNRSKPLTGLLSWEPADELIERIRSIGPWYIHSPEKGMETLFVAEAGEASAFLAERIEDVKNRKQGAGWVYVHTPDAPSWIKIYDPYKCASCGTRSPKAWWEMALEDPREEQPQETPVGAGKSVLHWLKNMKS
ncbi:MAG: hypothetical protein AABY87_05745 [bacterium]